MNALATCCFFALLAAGSASTVGSVSTVSPITRVVNLMKDLLKQSEKEGKAEENIYESYVCWGKKLIKNKKATNAAAADRIEYLGNFIQDEMAKAKNGAANALTKEIGELLTQAEQAKETRDKENADFEAAKAEMNSAITALTSASSVLATATQNHTTGTFLAVRSSLSHGMAAFQQQKVVLKQAAALGERFLSHADSVFLRRLLTGDIGDVKVSDKPTISKSPTFKMKYKARSFKIQDVLAKMKVTFVANLAEAQAKEDKALAIYEGFYAGFFDGGATKGTQTAIKEEKQETLANNQVSESDANAAWSGAVTEKAELEAQIAADEIIIADTEAKLVSTRTEFENRNTLRDSETAAINKAIATLTSDDVRDLMRKSLSSQGFFFLQTAQHSSSAAAAIRKAALKTSSHKLLAFAELVKGTSSTADFSAIVAKIDNMITKMGTDEANDLQQKEDCEAERLAQGRIAAVDSRIADALTDDINVLIGEEADLAKEIKELNENIKNAQDEKAEATAQRSKENKAFIQSQADDTAAAATVGQAKQTLEDFYSANPAFLQGQTVARVKKADSSQADAPEPATFHNKAVVHKESTGIIMMLSMIVDDINADKAEALRDENKAVADNNAFQAEQDADIKRWSDRVEEAEGILGAKVILRGNKNTDRKAAKERVAAATKVIVDATEGCDYFTINYKLRHENRAVELDGLREAKAALSGSKYNLLAVQRMAD